MPLEKKSDGDNEKVTCFSHHEGRTGDMKTRWSVPAVFVGLAALIAFSVAGAAGGDDNGRNRVAGSYLIDAEILLPIPEAPPRPFKWLITLTSDGALAGDATTDFGADVSPRFKSAQRGTWQWTGNREVAATILNFDYGPEEDGIFGKENRYYAIPRITTTIRFEERFEQVYLEALVEVFLSDQDPLDPDETPDGVTLGLRGVGRRIPAMFDDED